MGACTCNNATHHYTKFLQGHCHNHDVLHTMHAYSHMFLQEGKFSSAVSAYQDLQLNLAALEQRLSVLNDKEDEFLHSVAKEHNAVQVRIPI